MTSRMCPSADRKHPALDEHGGKWSLKTFTGNSAGSTLDRAPPPLSTGVLMAAWKTAPFLKGKVIVL